MAYTTILISVYVRKYGLWACSFRARIRTSSSDFNKPEEIAKKLSTLRYIFCLRSESFIHVYYYDKEQLMRLFISCQDTKDEIYKNIKTKKATKGTLTPLYFDNIITMKFL